mgnify:CR=1 FL=1
MLMTKKVLIYLSYNYKTRIHTVINEQHFNTKYVEIHLIIKDKDSISIDVLETGIFMLLIISKGLYSLKQFILFTLSTWQVQFIDLLHLMYYK